MQAQAEGDLHEIVGPKDKPSSKYDYVKVRVWIDDHYYILSRFLICRYLTVTKVVHDDAIKISLELKKVLVDKEMMDVKHSEMEEILFVILRKHGYDEDCISKFKLMTKFHHLRIPLIILITGTGCVGKSTLATQLSERLNLPSVLQTDLVYEVMKSLGSENFSLDEMPIWYRRFETDAEFLLEFQRECKVIRQGVEGEIHKCLEEGKSIIIEGSHLDLSQYTDILQRGVIKREEGERAKPFILVPFLITADDSERMVFLENYLRSSGIDNTSLGGTIEEQRQTLVHNFAITEKYLVGNVLPQTQVIRMSVRAFRKALETLQDVVVSRIQLAVQALQESRGDKSSRSEGASTPRVDPEPSVPPLPLVPPASL